MNSIPLRHLRFLDLSAASGLLLLNEKFYVIADDELSLSIFSHDLRIPDQTISLVEGKLPSDPKERKKQKPDFESLVYLPNTGSILVVPSGSKPNRVLGALVRGSQIQQIQFANLFHFLSLQNPDLNIEGSVIAGSELKLFHRGNGPSQQNAVIRLNLEIVIKELGSTKSLSSASFKSFQSCDLGQIQDQQLSFTDAAVESPERIWYLAVAEGGNSTYDDGKYLGSVIGCMNSQNQILFQMELDCPSKPEGLAFDFAHKKFYVVTDADDHNQLAQLLEGDLEIIRRLESV